MPIAWFICPYIVTYPKEGFLKTRRWPAVHELIADITADGGAWAGSEGLGNTCVCKVRASENTLTKIAALDGVVRLTKEKLTDSLSDLSSNQKSSVNTKLESMGYKTAEIQSAIGSDIGNVTLGDVLRFAASKRLTPRFDEVKQEFVLDGAERPVKPIADTDKEVSDK